MDMKIISLPATRNTTLENGNLDIFEIVGSPGFMAGYDGCCAASAMRGTAHRKGIIWVMTKAADGRVYCRIGDKPISIPAGSAIAGLRRRVCRRLPNWQ